jgi:ketosteroid isomerase-like protein
VKRTMAVALLTLLLGASLRAASADVQAERAALFRQDKAWAQAAAAKDVDKVVSYWADRAHVFPPGQPAVVGKDALRRYVSEAFAAPGFSISWETSDFVVSDSGDVAYGVASNVVTIQDAQGKLVTEHGRAITVWRKGPDGIWKCVVDMWNAAPAAPPPPK